MPKLERRVKAKSWERELGKRCLLLLSHWKEQSQARSTDFFLLFQFRRTMLATSVCGGRRLTRTILTTCSFHSALKRQLKADKKAKEKEAKLSAVAAASETGKVNQIGL